MNQTTFSDLKLRSTILTAVEDRGYTSPTEVQSRAIPILLGGHDLLATAQTGAGKTAAFVLPMLQALAEMRPNAASTPDGRQTGRRSSRAPIARPIALMLAPTRELAVQIDASVREYGAGSRLKATVVFGGAPKPTQARELAKQPAILTATPGRLLDFINEGRIDLSEVRYFVLDEADRMLDMGFMPDVRRISDMTAKDRQTVLFSATMPQEIERLANDIQVDPQRVECQAGQMNVAEIDQSVLFVEATKKVKLLTELIVERGMYKVLVFTRTKHKATRLAKMLAKSRIESDSIHGDRTQSQRQRALEAFRRGKIQVLVATDVAARGIDVDNITHVINFEMPAEAEAETYVHRIGRTGRAGAEGKAISFCSQEEVGSLQAIEALIKRSIEVDSNHEWHINITRTSSRKGGKPQNRGRGNRARGGGRGNGAGNGGGGDRNDRRNGSPHGRIRKAARPRRSAS